MKSSILLSIAAIAAQVIALPTTHDERSLALPVRDMNLEARVDVRPILRRNKAAQEQQADAADDLEDDPEDLEDDSPAPGDLTKREKDAKDANNNEGRQEWKGQGFQGR
ncbi:hypothetical protein LX36DRAFT_715836 [Colletotrichum falcatum]|nr:hypothetical protein LX36DRAFT_715836 [Colletotrichum falcatum]